MSWPIATVGEVCEVVSGATPRTGAPECWGGNVPWVTPKDLSELGQKHLGDTPRKITKAGLDSCSARMLPAQSVLFSSRAPIGLVAINTLPVCTNQGFKSLVPRFDLVSPDFLYWWLKVHEKHIQSKGRGATFKEISKKIVEDLQIPLPPLAEQKRIAGILDAADALRAKRREALAQLDTLLQSTFLDMFGDPVTNPMGWEVVELVSLIERGDKINYGVVQPGDDFPDGKPLIRVGDFVAGELVTSNLKLIDPAIERKYQRSRLNGRELLVSCVGSIGTVCTVPSEAEGFNIARAVARVPLVEGVDRDFMLHCLRCEAVQRHFFRETRTVSQPTLNIGVIKNAPVIQPPAILRNRFATIVESVEQQKTRQLAHLAELDTLFASLQSRAFRGDL